MRSRPIEDFYLAADGDDWSPAFRRAQLAMGSHESLRILLDSRTYRCATAISVFRRLEIVGKSPYGNQSQAATSTGETDNLSRLWFSTGSHGLILHVTGSDGVTAGSNNFDTHTPNATDPSTIDTSADCRHVTLRDFVLEGIGRSSTVGHFHGIIPFRKFTMYGMCVSNWPGYNIYINVDTGGLYPTSLAGIGTTVTFEGNCNNFIMRDSFLLNSGRANMLVRANNANASTIDQVSFDAAGFTYFPDRITWTGTPSPSSATVGAGPVLNITFNTSSHGFSVNDWAILREVKVAGVDYTTKCYEPVKVTTVVGAVVTFDMSSVTSTTWPTSGAVTFTGTFRMAKVQAAIPSAATFTADRTLQLTVPSHSFQLNDIVLVRGVTSSTTEDRSSRYYPQPLRVSATTATTVTVIGPETWPSSGTPTLESNATLFGFELLLANLSQLNNTYTACKMQPTVLGGIQTYDDSANSVFIGHYEETNAVPTIIDSNTIVLGGNLSNNTVADAYRAGGALVKADGTGGLTIQRYAAAYPLYKDHGVVSYLGGIASDQMLSFNFRNNADLSGSDAELLDTSLEFSHESGGLNNGGYIGLRAGRTNGDVHLSIPVLHNSRNKRTPLLNAGVYMGCVSDTSTFVGQNNIVSNPTAYSFFGSNRVVADYTPFFFGEGHNFRITALADNGGGLIRVTSSGHGLVTGDRVIITGVDGVTAANGHHIITYVSSTQFDLTASFSGTYTTYTATLSTAVYNSDANWTTITVTGASGTLVAKDRVDIGSSATSRDWQVLYVSGSTIRVLGDASALTGTLTMNSGMLSKVHAIGYSTTPPTTGNWANGDIIYNTNPVTSGIFGWVCTVGNESGGTWKILTQSSAFTYDSNCTMGQTHTIYKAITSGGSTGTADDVTIVDATTLPYAIRIVDIQLAISTADGTGSSTATLRTASGGAGSALSEAFAIDSTGVKRKSSASVLSTTAATTDGLYLRRSSRDCVGEITITYIINE